MSDKSLWFLNLVSFLGKAVVFTWQILSMAVAIFLIFVFLSLCVMAGVEACYMSLTSVLVVCCTVGSLIFLLLVAAGCSSFLKRFGYRRKQ